MRYQFITSLCVATALTGCASISSTALTRMDDNSVSGNSNGEPGWLCGKNRPFKGVPITLEVPTHLDVFIIETYYLMDTNDGFQEVSVGTKRNLGVKTEIVKTKKIFTVDMKRPAAGTLNVNTDFSDAQYFSSIDSKLTDTTVNEVAAAINRLVPAFANLTEGSTPSDESTELAKLVTRGERVIAYQRFDINSVDFECQVETFANRHLNDCHQCPVGGEVMGEVHSNADPLEEVAPENHKSTLWIEKPSLRIPTNVK